MENDGRARDGSTPAEVVREAMRVLDWNPEDVAGVEYLDTGIAGAGAYRLRMAYGTEMVLKVKRPDAPQHQWENARREARFYLHLSDLVPLKLPFVHTVCDREDGSFLLMDRYAPMPPAAQWAEGDFLQAARDIAVLHAAFWDRADELAQFSFLHCRSLEVTPDEVEFAHKAWAYQAGQERFQSILTPERIRRIEGWIERLPETQQFLAALPPTLIHGDCHAGNVLRDADGIYIWTDWSNVAIGRGPEDVSFLYQRAVMAGAAISLEPLMAAYHESLASHLGRDFPLASLQRAAEASEWNVRLLQWPHYLDWSTPETLRAFMGRLDDLAATLL